MKGSGGERAGVRSGTVCRICQGGRTPGVGAPAGDFGEGAGAGRGARRRPCSGIYREATETSSTWIQVSPLAQRPPYTTRLVLLPDATSMLICV